MKKTSLLCATLVFMLVGCGQKGPLYLPQPAKPLPDAPKTVPGTAPETAPAPAPKQTTTGN